MTKVTKRAVDAALPREQEFTLWDDEVPGFGLRVRPSGAKTYVFKYRIGGGRAGRVRKATIGIHGHLTPDQARGIAKDWAAVVRTGGDPAGRRQETHGAPKVKDLFERYLEEHARPHKKPRSASEDERLIEARLKPAFGQLTVSEIGRADIVRMHRGLAEKPYEANRALALISKIMNLAELWGLRPDGSNPCRHVKRYREQRRERFLSQQELARLGAALAAAEKGELPGPTGAPISRYATTAIRLLIFTGARKGEILGLRWSEVNFEMGRLELPDSKTGAKVVHLPPPAIEILRDLPRIEGNPYVVVGGKPGEHLVNIEDGWRAIRAHAGLDDVRIHDLRHSFASVGAAGGMSLPVIGALLGHRNVATTARYSHLSDDPLRQAAAQIGQRLHHAMTGNTKEPDHG